MVRIVNVSNPSRQRRGGILFSRTFLYTGCMKQRTLLIASLVALTILIASNAAHAEEQNPELRITPAGEIHLIGAGLWQKHAANLYTIKAWGMKWTVEIPYGMTLLSAHGAVIKSEEFKQGDSLEIKGRVVTKNSLDYSIDLSMIKNISVQTGEPKPLPSPPVPTPTPAPIPAPATTAKAAPKGLYMALQKGYRGGQVSLLQKFLQGQGLIKGDGVSGYFGVETEKALKKFQAANILEATGTLGPKTRSLI